VIPLQDDAPIERTPVVTVALIAVNVAAFAWQIGVAGLDLSALRGGAIPYEILTGRDIWPPDVVPPPFTILTSMFLHGGFLHIGSNMLFLWIFGNNVEDALGRLRFVLFYVACGVAAALAQVVASAVMGDVEVPMVGASGAIAGVLAAYMVMFPRANVKTLVFFVIFIRVLFLPAAVFIGLWFVLQVLSVFLGGAPGVAVFAHIGGFLTGWLLVRTMGRRPRRLVRPASW